MKLRLFLAVLVSGILSAAVTSAASPESKLTELKITLPETSPPVANYVPAVRSGKLLFLAGHIPRDTAGKPMTGKVGTAVSIPDAQAAARRTGLALLATLRQELGSLDRVKRIVRVEGFVNCPTDFTKQSTVINGCSDLLVEVFGDAGRHARMAIGAGSLPLDCTVEIALIAEIK